MSVQKNEIINTAFFYFKEGKDKDVARFRSRGNVILEKYGARIERVIKPTMIATGDLEMPDEVHFAVYPDGNAKAAFDKDPEFLQLKEDYLAPNVDRMFGFATKNDPNFSYYREIGDTTKTFGIALIHYKEGKEHQDRFTEYHNEACEIIPEFGAHFERFLIPFGSANDIWPQPNEIHRFYFDDPEGLQHMVDDERMRKLFPKRDASLKDLVFILGEAIQ